MSISKNNWFEGFNEITIMVVACLLFIFPTREIWRSLRPGKEGGRGPLRLARSASAPYLLLLPLRARALLDAVASKLLHPAMASAVGCPHRLSTGLLLFAFVHAGCDTRHLNEMSL
jgi:hypothetical protein